MYSFTDVRLAHGQATKAVQVASGTPNRRQISLQSRVNSTVFLLPGKLKWFRV